MLIEIGHNSSYTFLSDNCTFFGTYLQHGFTVRLLQLFVLPFGLLVDVQTVNLI